MQPATCRGWSVPALADRSESPPGLSVGRLISLLPSNHVPYLPSALATAGSYKPPA